jgi:hypothetical protein
MRFSATVAICSSLLMQLPAYAEPATEARARVIEKAIADFLPKALADAEVIRLAPAGDHFDLMMDLSRLFDPADQTWRLTDATPISRLLAPGADGNWRLEGNGPFRFKADSLQANRPNSVSVEAGDFSTSALIDVGLGFANSADIGLKDARIAFRSGQDSLKFGLTRYDARIRVENRTSGKGDLVNRFAIDGFTEYFGSFPNAEVRVRIGSISGVQKATGLDFEAIKALGIFHRAQIAKSATVLSDVDAAELKTVLKRHVPLVQGLGEETIMSDVVLESAGKAVTGTELGYQWRLDDIARDGLFTISSQLSGLAAREGTLPKGSEELLPESVRFKISYSGFKLGALTTEWAEDPRGDRLRQDPARYDRLLSPGPLTIALNEFAVKSPAYDISADGSMTFMMANTREPKIEVTITARNFDRTVTFLQERAKSVPQMSQLVVAALMAKGFGEAMPDGAMRWKIEIDAAKRLILINGQRVGG